jgi:transcriptional regulator with XRE-family HTH domain
MKDRIILLIKAKNLTAAQFADEINVQKSSISHIISGRNNASLDFVQKVLSRYPEVSMEWLMWGKGPVFKGDDFSLNNNTGATSKTNSGLSSGPVDLFSDIIPDPGTDFGKENELTLHEQEVRLPTNFEIPENASKEKNEHTYHDSVKTTHNPLHEITRQSIQKDNKTKSVLKIVEFYTDNTYREFFPE